MIIDAKRKRTAANAWIESIDPLNGLSIAQAKTIFNAARRHGSPLLQKIYDEIEGADPTLMTCVERRASALSGLGWRAVADASAPDEDAAEEQRRALEKFADGIANLDEAIEHLDLGFFRGFSVVQPVWEGGIVRTVHLLDSWNFLFGEGGELLWNPECSPDPARCEEIRPSARIVVLRRRRAIDWPALTVFLRKYIGERDWGRFAERYGIPPVDAVMAPNATKEQRGDYLEAVEAARDGRGVVWPSGSSVSRAEGARGQDPFTAFVEHQEKQIVLMATGGTLTSLAQADTGSLAGGAQMDVWEQIVSRDGVAISGALNRGLFLPYLRERFPGAAPMARIVLGKEAEPTAKEAAQLAGSIRSAGYRVDQSQLEEATGFKLEREETPQQPGFGGFANKATPQDPDSGLAKPLQNAPRGAGATEVPKDGETRLEAILDDFSAKLAEEMQDEMAKAAAAALGERETGNGEETEANKEGNPYHCPKCGKFAGFNGHCDKCGYTLDADETQKRAERLMEKAQSGTMLKPVDGLAFRKEIGQIDLEVGRRGVGKQQEHGTGLAKLRQKHGQDVHALAETLAHGEVMPTTKETKVGNPYDPDRRAIVHGNYVIFLARKGDRRWRISTHYKSAGEATKAEEIKQWLRSGDRSHLQGGAV